MTTEQAQTRVRVLIGFNALIAVGVGALGIHNLVAHRIAFGVVDLVLCAANLAMIPVNRATLRMLRRIG